MGALSAAVYLGIHLTRRPSDEDHRPISKALRSYVLGPDPHAREIASTVLVEFGDYECPPCRKMSPEIDAIVERSKGSLDFRFRNYPLKDIHPLAYRLATVAEVARAHGVYAQAHALLYKEPKVAALRTGLHRLGIYESRFTEEELSRAHQIVDRDLADATRLSLPGTPSFVLCRPDGHMELTTLRSVRDEFAPTVKLDR